jgi:hypothetical protein
MGRVLAIFCVALLGLGSLARAQDASLERVATPPAIDVAALTPEQNAQLSDWLSAVKKWQQYDEKWRNKPVRDGWGRITARRPSPAAPTWLAAHCDTVAAAGLAGFDKATAIACRVLADPRASFAEVPAPVNARPGADKPQPHSSFLTRLHVDGLWSTTGADRRLYGIVGAHMRLVDIGRLQIFGPPGVMLLTVPEGRRGGRRVTLGYTWGLSIRLVDMRVGAPTRNMTLFLNVSKVFLGSVATATAESRSYDMVGFSLAPRKNR